MNSQNEIEQILQNTAKPRKEFVQSLHASLQKEHSSRSSANNLTGNWFMNFFKSVNSKAGIAALSVVAVSAIGVGIFFTYQYKMMQSSGNNDTVAQSADILAKIREANANIDTSAKRSAAPTANGISSLVSSDSANTTMLRYIDPKERGYQFMRTETTYTYGPAKNSCQSLTYWMTSRDVDKMESVEFYEKNDDYMASHSRYAEYSGSKLYGVYIRKGTEAIEYYGGSYAVNFKNVAQIMPLAKSAVESTDDLALQTQEAPPAVDSVIKPTTVTDNGTVTSIDLPVVSNETQIVGKETVNGKEYYKMRTSYQTSCDINGNGTATQTIVTESLADSQTYLIIRESQYLGSVSDQNLVVQTNTTTEKKTSETLANIQNYFTVNGVTMKTIDQTQKEENQGYFDGVIAAIKKSKASLIMPESGYKAASLYTDKNEFVAERDKHYSDVAFYPSANDSRYTQYLDTQKQIAEQRNSSRAAVYRLGLETATEGRYVTVDAYAVQDANTLLTELYGVSSPTSATKSITVNGKTVSAKVYTPKIVDMDGGNSSPAYDPSAPDATVAPIDQKAEIIDQTKYMVFTYDGMVYIVSGSSTQIDSFTKLNAYATTSSTFTTTVNSLRPTE